MSLTQNHLQFEGLAEVYAHARPAPPPQLRAYLAKLVGVELSSEFGSSQGQQLPLLRVLDLGCGTGVSTFYWDGYATEVIGVDPGDDLMGKALESKAQYSKMSFVKGYSHSIPVPDESIDLVTCSQSFHWMDPTPTFKEIRRILRKGGLLAVYDYDIPMTVLTADRSIEECFDKCLENSKRLTLERGLPQTARAAKEGHLARMKESQQFSHCREITLSHVDKGDAARVTSFILSMGQIGTSVSHGITREELEIPALEAAAKRVIGEGTADFLWSYRVRLAFK